MTAHPFGVPNWSPLVDGLYGCGVSRATIYRWIQATRRAPGEPEAAPVDALRVGPAGPAGASAHATGALVLFSFDARRSIRVVTRAGDPWFVLSDLCAVLGIGNPSDVAARLGPHETALDAVEGNGATRQLMLVSESGMYAAIFKSRKPEAERFRQWVTGDVIPSIRRTGAYAAPARACSLTPATSARCRTASWSCGSSGLTPGAGLPPERRSRLR
jgi:prophage antirepressor-like protein